MMGRPGCGKGTQAKLLSDFLGAQVFSSGARYRSIATEDSFIGHKIKGIIDSGELTPSWFAAYLFTEVILKLSLEDRIIFEGAARKLEEAKRIDDVLGWLMRPYTIVHLDVSEEEIRNRISKRAEIEGRKDDGKHSIEVRLKAYAEDTAPAIEYFRSCGKVLEIDGSQSQEAVFAEIKAKIAELA